MASKLLTVLTSAALLAGCAAGPAGSAKPVEPAGSAKPAGPADCDVSDADGLGDCIKQLLMDAQSRVRWPWELDPLKFPDQQYGDLKTWDAILIDLSHYKVDNVSVSFLDGKELAVKAVLRWPELTGVMSAELKKCKHFVFDLCASANARPHVYLKDTVGVVTTVFKVNWTPGSQLTIRPSDSKVTLKLGNLKVKANLRGLVGAVNYIIGDPASQMVTKLTNDWWRHNSGRVQNVASEIVEKLVEKEVSAALEKLLN